MNSNCKSCGIQTDENLKEQNILQIEQGSIDHSVYKETQKNHEPWQITYLIHKSNVIKDEENIRKMCENYNVQ